MKKKDLAEIVKRIKKKISDESPYDYKRCSNELKLQIVETFYRVVLDEMEINKVAGDFAVNVYDEHFKNFEPFSPITEFEKVYSELPEPTDKFIISEVLKRTDCV